MFHKSEQDFLDACKHNDKHAFQKIINYIRNSIFIKFFKLNQTMYQKEIHMNKDEPLKLICKHNSIDVLSYIIEIYNNSYIVKYTSAFKLCILALRYNSMDVVDKIIQTYNIKFYDICSKGINDEIILFNYMKYYNPKMDLDFLYTLFTKKQELFDWILIHHNNINFKDIKLVTVEYKFLEHIMYKIITIPLDKQQINFIYRLLLVFGIRRIPLYIKSKNFYNHLTQIS